MRSLLVSLFVLLFVILAFTACGDSGSITVATPVPETSVAPVASPITTQSVTPSPSSSPAVDPEIEAVITDFISAQNAHDWSSFLSLWINAEQKYYKDFFAYPNNEKNRNGYFAIKSAKLAGIYEIANVNARIDDDTFFDLPYEIEDSFDYGLPDAYGNVRMFIVKAGYALDKEFWDYREGTNYRVIVLVAENGQWKVVQDYQGYPGAAEYFGDPVPVTQDEEDEESDDIEEEESKLVDGTVHYTKKLDCYFLSLDWGDYMHMGVRTIEGDEIWFWMGHTEVDPETLTRNQKIRITWKNIDVYVEEAEEVINEDLVTDIILLD